MVATHEVLIGTLEYKGHAGSILITLPEGHPLRGHVLDQDIKTEYRGSDILELYDNFINAIKEMGE